MADKDYNPSPESGEPIPGRTFAVQTREMLNEIDDDVSIANTNIQNAIDIATGAQTTAENTQDALNVHIADTDVHGATSEATAGRIIIRSDTGTAQVATPAARADIANKGYVDDIDSRLTGNVNDINTELVNINAEMDELATDVSNMAGQLNTTTGTANTALSTARTALGRYTVVADRATFDANDYYKQPGKFYVNTTDLANFPAGLTLPFYFDIIISEDETSVLQWIRTQDNTQSFQRTGTVSGNTVTFTQWEEGGSGSNLDESALKDLVLAPININNADSDIDQAIGINGYYYIQNTAIANLPTETVGILQVLSDTAKTHTFQQYASADFELFYRNSTSQLDIGIGTSSFKITATSGSKSVEDTLDMQAAANGDITLRSKSGANFSINERINGGVVIAGKIDLYIDDTDYKTNGFTLTIADESGSWTDSISLNVASDGTITPATDTATASNAYIRYQSGYLDVNAGGTVAEFYITATWTNYTGTPSWTDWNIIGGASGDVNYASNETAAAGTVSDQTISPATLNYAMSQFGLFGASVYITATAPLYEDYNEIIANGKYFVNPNSGLNNAPPTTQYIFLEVINFSNLSPTQNLNVCQTAIERNNTIGKIYYRMCIAGVWSEWMQLYPALPTASNAQAIAGVDTSVTLSPANLKAAMDQFGEFGRNNRINTGDLNDYIYTGFYYTDAIDGTVANLPVQAYGYLIIQNNGIQNLTRTSQIWITASSTDSVYYRRRVDDTWTNWYQIYPVNVATGTTGILPVANGGTGNMTNTASNSTQWGGYTVRSGANLTGTAGTITFTW